jgi:23S rRNA (guanosine2251-2'-O)-methyltransferase
VKNFRHQHHRPKKNTLIVGRDAVMSAIREGKNLDRIYVQSNVQGSWVEELKALANTVQVPINKVPVEKLNSFNVFNHEGCVAQISKIQYQDLQSIISFTVENGKTPLFILLDGVTDIRNIGAIARSAYSFGADAIIIPDRGVGALNEDAILTSAGALEKLSICRVNSLMKAVDDLHLNGIKVYASEMKAEKQITSMDFTEPVAIVMGGEEKGIYPALMKQCDASFQIPMPGDFESLNVSVATGIILYEVCRQRG